MVSKVGFSGIVVLLLLPSLFFLVVDAGSLAAGNNAIKISGEDVSQIYGWSVTPDRQRAVFLADRENQHAGRELFSVPVSGGEVVKLNVPLTLDDGFVSEFVVTLDSSTVVYGVVDDSHPAEFYTVPVAGGESTHLDLDWPASTTIVQSFKVSNDGAFLIADVERAVPPYGALLCAPTDGGPSLTLSPTDTAYREITGDSSWVVFSEGGQLSSVPITGGLPTILTSAGSQLVKISPDSSTVVYVASREIYAVPVTGGPSTRISLEGQRIGGIFPNEHDYAIAPDSSRVVYTVDQVSDSLWSAPIDGGSAVDLSGPLVSGGNVSRGGFQVAANSATVVFAADKEVNGKSELFSVPITGGAVTKISGAMDPDADAGDASIYPDSATVIFKLGHAFPGGTELYGTTITGGATARLSDPMLHGGDLETYKTVENGLALYAADQDTQALTELYVTTATGLGGVTELYPDDTGSIWGVSIYQAALPRVVFLADADTPLKNELFSVLLDGDADADGADDGHDCLAFDPDVWAIPGDVPDLALTHVGGPDGVTTLNWTEPEVLGGFAVAYDTLRSSDAVDFVSDIQCVEVDDGADTTAIDTDAPPPGEVRFFLVRAKNACGGSAGSDSSGTPIAAGDCS